MAQPTSDPTELQHSRVISIEPVGDPADPKPIGNRQNPVGRDSDDSVVALRQALDESQTRLLAALDAVAGAEAETGAAGARIRELELEQHMLVVERDELRRELDRLTAQQHPILRRIVRLAWSAARKLPS